MPYKVACQCEAKKSSACASGCNPLKKEWYATNAETGRRLSKNPLTKAKARKQEVAVVLGEARKAGRKPGTYFA